MGLVCLSLPLGYIDLKFSYMDDVCLWSDVGEYTILTMLVYMLNQWIDDTVDGSEFRRENQLIW